ncbi:MAG: C39 family peptidase [Oscillospiraceae bacterium]|nr:C39 family peptidase [Oscillospiraceae bacterium]
MNETRKTPPRPKSRQPLNPVFVLMGLSIAVLIALIVFMAMLKSKQKAVADSVRFTEPSASTATTPEPTDPEPSVPNTSQPAATTPSASTLPSEPTIPSEPTAADIIADFAAQHGLTLADYPEELIALLERNPEAQEFVLNYPLEHDKEHTVDISGYATQEGVPLFIQWDQQWGYVDFAGKLAGLSACGPTCMSMVAYHFTRNPQYTPVYMMEFAMSNKAYAVNGSGTQWAFFQKGPQELGLSVQELTLEQSQTESYIAKTLQAGKVIVMNVRPGVFTTVGHYLLLTGYEDGKFKVNDPNSYENSEKLWEFEEFSDQVRIMWAISE